MEGKTAPPQKGSGTDVFHQAFLSRSFKYNNRNNNKNEDAPLPPMGNSNGSEKLFLRREGS